MAERNVAPPSARVLRAASFFLVLLAAAVIAGAAIGLAVTQYHDRRVAAERHAALQTALAEIRVVFGDIHRFNRAQLRLIARHSGLKDLRFGADPAQGGGREIQSLQDAHGRIVGWFSWAPDRALILAMDWLWSFVGVGGIALVLGAIVARRTAQRLAGSLAQSLQAMRKLTSEDALTGLPNARVMLEGLDSALRRREREGTAQVAFALLDLDGLREVNDTLGRKGGDAALIAVAQRLAAGLPPGAFLGRFEDDEFAAIAAGAEETTAIALAEALRASLSEPFVLAAASAGQAASGQRAAGQVWRISGAIGVAQAPEDGASAEELARRAALALRAAKRDGRGAVRRFAAPIEIEHSDRLFLLRELKSAIADNAFDVHYQPIVAAAGGAMIGVEALLRWTHKTRGAVAPATFIPLAEQYGLMNELGEFVLRRALAAALRWPHMLVAVNLSPVQIRDRGLVDLVAAIIAETGIEASRVVLEITEGTLIDDPEETQRTLEALRRLGVSIALDDFGTGYSSLSYLQRFPFQRLKIDRAFVASLGAVGNAGAIIHSIVTLGHALGMNVLAEGVETDQQRVLLRLAGCDEMQGYLFARPRPAEAIDKIMSRSAVSPQPADEQGRPAAAAAS